MNFIMKGILFQSDLVSVIFGFNYFLLNIYKTLTNTCIYMSKYYKFNVNI